MPSDTLVDLVALSLLPVLWWREAGERLRLRTPPADILESLIAGHRAAADRTPGALRTRASAALERGTAVQIEAVGWADARYPPMLSAIVDPPPVLWVRGCCGALQPTAVAIVGSRAGSPYALAVAERLGADLAARGVAVVSGLARGVDSAAHRGALAAGGITIGVLGSGADMVYPREHTALAAEMSTAGAIVSEFVPGTPPHPAFFPRRNRVISGLARAIVVVEAGRKSGSLITARCALEQGREVLAVPGNVLSGRNLGGHALLRDGAKIVETADDILEELGIGTEAGVLNRAAAGAWNPLLACFPAGESCNIDEIAERSGLPAARLLPRLLELELQGLIRRAGGGRFVRLDTSC
jgi:DNA processing protein